VQHSFYKMVFDPNNNAIAYIASRYGLHKSTDGGLSWNLTTLLGSFDRFVYEVSVHPNSSDTIYAGTDGWTGPKDLYRSVNEGNNWTNLNLTNGESGIKKVLFNPTNTDMIYVGAFEKGIYKSTDRGVTWFTINNGLQISDPPLIKPIYSLDINNLDPNILYSDNGGVVKTTNGGQEWFRIDSMLFELDENLQVGRIAYINNKIFVSSNNGLYNTSNDGITWQKIGNFKTWYNEGEVKNSLLNPLKIFISTKSGIYKGIDTVTSVEKIEDVPMYPILLQNYPNPFNSNTKISFNLDKRRFITIKIYNVLGKEVNSIIEQTRDKGTNIVGWDGTNYNGENLPSGIYF
ncbi:MAG: T9SS type A sorting domain-containing protein, partial [Candidatus Margulisbacteria bacterium]|nr:T9SS type A sorting domain-containing protein [Candidatus Margulisiibacteriota bacterium]